jgi:hypothetical protein
MKAFSTVLKATLCWLLLHPATPTLEGATAGGVPPTSLSGVRLLVPGSPQAHVLQAVTFVRGEGKPQTFRTELSAAGFEGPYAFYLRNGTVTGENRVSSAVVRLNGKTLYSQSDFSQRWAGDEKQVALAEHSLLEVTLASAPGSELTVWIAGNRRLQIELDEAEAVTEEIPVEGGMVCADASSQASFCLTIPPGALLKAQQITITPLRSVANLPLALGFWCGVQIDPPTARLVRPATLQFRFEPPTGAGQLLGFGYEGLDQKFHLRPFWDHDGVIEMPIGHFSGFGVGGGTVADAAQAANTAAAGSDQYYKNLLAYITLTSGFPSEENVELYRGVLQEWFWDIVLPALTEAIELALSRSTDFDEFRISMGLYLEWASACSAYNLADDPTLAPLDALFKARLGRGLQDMFSDLQKACSATSGLCEKSSMLDLMLEWTILAQGLGYSAPEPLMFCGGVARTLVNSATIDPARVQVKVWNSVNVRVVAKTQSGEEIPDPPSLAVAWKLGDSSIATVNPSGGSTAEVVGVSPGETTLEASVSQCSHGYSSTAAVTVKPACDAISVEVSPAFWGLRVGDGVWLKATVMCDGTVDETIPVFWEFDDNCVQSHMAAGQMARFTGVNVCVAAIKAVVYPPYAEDVVESAPAYIRVSP